MAKQKGVTIDQVAAVGKNKAKSHLNERIVPF